MKSYSKIAISKLKEIDANLKEHKFFFGFVSIIILILLLTLMFISTRYIDLIFIFGWILLAVVSYFFSLKPWGIFSIPIFIIFLTGLFLLLGKDLIAEFLALCAYLFLSYGVVYTLLYFFLNKGKLSSEKNI